MRHGAHVFEPVSHRMWMLIFERDSTPMCNVLAKRRTPVAMSARSPAMLSSSKNG